MKKKKKKTQVWKITIPPKYELSSEKYIKSCQTFPLVFVYLERAYTFDQGLGKLFQ